MRSLLSGSLGSQQEPAITSRTLKLVILMALLALVISALNMGGRGAPPAAQAQTSWQLVWSDEFNGAANTGPDASKWQIEVTCAPANNEAQCYTNRLQNLHQNGAGQLEIVALREDYGGKRYTSGRMNTNGKATWTYGRFEARMKLPAGTGMWPAFWMLGNDIGSVGWPNCGEVDIMENRGRQPTTSSSAIHGPGYSGNTPIVHSYNLPAGAPSFFADYHVFAVEWTSTQFRFFVDGNLHYTVNKTDIERYGRWVFDHPQFLILNLAIGGVFDGNQLPPDSAFPAKVMVDWVHVYRAGTGTNPTATHPPGATATRTRTATAGGTNPTATRTRTATTSSSTVFTQGVDNVSSTQARVWFKPNGWTASYVIIHYTRPGLGQQNVQMTYNSTAARWEYTVGSLSAGQTLQYQFTYNRSGAQSDTAWYSWVKP